MMLNFGDRFGIPSAFDAPVNMIGSADCLLLHDWVEPEVDNGHSELTIQTTSNHHSTRKFITCISLPNPSQGREDSFSCSLLVPHSCIASR